MPKVGVILSGCGVFDGSEIHESVLTLLFLDREKVNLTCLSIDEEFDVVDHSTKTASGEKRNVLVESARIARGDIADLKNVKAKDLDALILPGGFGAAKNLSNFAVYGEDCEVNSEVKRIINEMYELKKPIGAICIAPVVVAAALRGKGLSLTIGYDAATAGKIELMGHNHVECAVDDCVVDDVNKVVTTPAYMLGPNISDIAKGIEKLVKSVLSIITVKV